MADMFSKWSYLAKDGAEVPIPIGVSKPAPTQYRDRLRIVVSTGGKQLAIFDMHKVEVLSCLISAVTAWITFIRNGKSVNKFHNIKRQGADATLPVGISLEVDTKRSIYRLQVLYPCLIQNKPKRKYFPVGVGEPHRTQLDAVVKEATEFRENQIELYRQECIRRAEECLQKINKELSNG